MRETVRMCAKHAPGLADEARMLRQKPIGLTTPTAVANFDHSMRTKATQLFAIFGGCFCSKSGVKMLRTSPMLLRDLSKRVHLP
jgi:hypothetical protein